LKPPKTNKGQTLGYKIRTNRKSKGLTLNDLSQQIGISIQALSAIETDKANPSRQTLISLARILGDDFGESGLKRYATGTRKSTHNQLLGETIKARDLSRGRSSIPNPYIESILDWSFEVRDAANLPSPVRIFNQKSALMPMHYEITNGITLNSNEDGYKIVVPYSLIPSIEKARCIRVQESPIREAFLSPGDVLVISERSAPEEGKIVLAIVDDKIMIRKWEVSGRKVILTALDPNYAPVTVQRKSVEFVGELLGVLRFISLVPVPFFT
jgi:SOS-response transcriptional repressor LexA